VAQLLSMPVEEAIHHPLSSCRPLAEAVRGYSRFSGKPLTPDGYYMGHGTFILSALLGLTFCFGKPSGISAFILWPVFLFFGSRIQVMLVSAPSRGSTYRRVPINRSQLS
jgi:hypothetical protein